MNLFEIAVRNHIRFPSSKGMITVEDLWDVPLRSRGTYNLNNIAKTINNDLKSVADENFVGPSTSPRQSVLETSLNIVKYIIADKLAAEAAAKQLQSKRAERQTLLGILAGKKNEALEGLSVEELEARIASLS